MNSIHYGSKPTSTTNAPLSHQPLSMRGRTQSPATRLKYQTAASSTVQHHHPTPAYQQAPYHHHSLSSSYRNPIVSSANSTMYTQNYGSGYSANNTSSTNRRFPSTGGGAGIGGAGVRSYNQNTTSSSSSPTSLGPNYEYHLHHRNTGYSNRHNTTHGLPQSMQPTTIKRLPVKLDEYPPSSFHHTLSSNSGRQVYQSNTRSIKNLPIEDELSNMSLTTKPSRFNTYSSGKYDLDEKQQQQQQLQLQQQQQQHQQQLRSEMSITTNGQYGQHQPTSQFFAPVHGPTAAAASAAATMGNGKSSNISSSSSTSSTSSSSSSPPMIYFGNGGTSSSSSSVLNHGAKNAALNGNSSGDDSDDAFGAGLGSKGLSGLKNLGNICFMNSIFQCLSNTRHLLEYCLRGTYSNDLNTTLSVMKGSLFKSYANLIKSMWKNNDIVVPSDMYHQITRFAPKFKGYAQHDAEEFLNYLLKGLHEDVNLVKKKPSIKFDEQAWDRMSDVEKSEEHWSINLRIENSRISEIFSGQLKSTLRCLHCDHRSPTFEVFWHLPVPIPNGLRYGSIKLDDCIKLFMNAEILDGEDKPTCSRCKEKQRSEKRYTIERLPKVLVIQLKRFLKAHYTQKIEANVTYPIENLDMSRYLSKNVEMAHQSSPPPTHTSVANKSNCLYDLYAISLHSGSGSSGHYVAYCKHPYSKKWHYFNDSMVREISNNSLQDPNAYILFYQLKS